MRRSLALLVSAAAIGAFSHATPTAALFTGSAGLGANGLGAATLTAPAGLAAAAECQGTGTARVNLTWFQAARADGYDLYRGATSGGPYTFLTHETGGATTAHTDGDLTVNTTYYYVARSTRGDNWESSDSSQASATTPILCL